MSLFGGMSLSAVTIDLRKNFIDRHAATSLFYGMNLSAVTIDLRKNFIDRHAAMSLFGGMSLSAGKDLQSQATAV